MIGKLATHLRMRKQAERLPGGQAASRLQNHACGRGGKHELGMGKFGDGLLYGSGDQRLKRGMQVYRGAAGGLGSSQQRHEREEIKDSQLVLVHSVSAFPPDCQLRVLLQVVGRPACELRRAT